jgi:hypothetical protein
MIKERVENRTTVILNATPLQRVIMTRKNGLIGLAFLCVTIPLMLVAQPAEKNAHGQLGPGVLRPEPVAQFLSESDPPMPLQGN